MPTIATDLLLDLADRTATAPVLVMGGEADLPNAIAGASYLPLDVREQRAASAMVIEEPAATSYATVILPSPPNRDLTRRLLLQATTSLQANGVLIVAGANAEGGKSALKDAESLFGAPMRSGYREKHRLGIFRKSEIFAPDWVHRPGVAPGTWQPFTVASPVGPLQLHTQAGVFAGPRLDAGTHLLLEQLDIAPGASVLDLGCGAGIIGLVAATMGAGSITMTDANLFAVATARQNALRLGIDAIVRASDVFDALDAQRFDLIVSNPPFHRGKHVDLDVANRLIADAPSHLTAGGSLLIVANAFLNHDMQMRRVFPQVDIVARTPQYHVIRGAFNH